MQKTIYTCDGCGDTIGDNKHISLLINNNQGATGIALPPITPENPSHRWIVAKKPKHNFMHFCTGVCVGNYFTELMNQTDGPSN